MKRLRCLIFALALALLPTPAHAATNSLYFKSFSADYYLSQDETGLSHLKVVEHITAVFPDTDQNHGIFRIIPFTNNDGQNLTMASNHKLDISVLRNGRPEPIADIERGDGHFNVKIGNSHLYLHGEQTYTLAYEFENVILDQYDDTNSWQEFFWDANGNDWDYKFEQVTARLHFADGIETIAEPACYTGRFGSTAKNCTITELDDGFEFASTGPLRSRENLSFVVAFASDTFTIPQPVESPLFLIVALAMTIFAGYLVYLMLRTHRSAKPHRDYATKRFVTPEYTPLKGATAAELGAIALHHPSGNPKVATLLELAVNHQVDFIESKTKGLFGKEKNVWQVQLKVSPDSLKTAEKVVLQILNGSADPLKENQLIELTSHSDAGSLYSLAESFTSNIESRIKKKGWRQDLDVKGYKPLLIGIALWCIAWIASIILLATYNDIPYLHFYAATFSTIYICLLGPTIVTPAIIVAVQANRFGTRSEKGLDASRYLDGLKLYIKMAEADRLKLLQSVEGADTSANGVVKLYEKLLPYAALLGLEKSWLDEMSKYYELPEVENPSWYVGASTFSRYQFLHSLNTITRNSAQSISHSTTMHSSSSGSGFSGGCSGGGGGGGGGGGW